MTRDAGHECRERGQDPLERPLVLHLSPSFPLHSPSAGGATKEFQTSSFYIRNQRR